jgi:hypothetical protein
MTCCGLMTLVDDIVARGCAAADELELELDDDVVLVVEADAEFAAAAAVLFVVDCGDMMISLLLLLMVLLLWLLDLPSTSIAGASVVFPLDAVNETERAYCGWVDGSPRLVFLALQQCGTVVH